MPPVEENADKFEVHPTYAVAGVLPDRTAVDEAVRTLDADGFDEDVIEVLDGEEGQRILDQRGTRHGVQGRLHRLLQNWTYYEQILGLYNDDLAKGEFIVVVPAGPDDRYRVARTLIAHGGHGMYFFGFNTVESLTAP
jgi:hypothetical protein